jgi:DNA-3-methyladenine glycosylase
VLWPEIAKWLQGSNAAIQIYRNTPETRAFVQEYFNRDLAGGPGRLCDALGIDLTWNGLPVAGGLRRPPAAAGTIRVMAGGAPLHVVASPRIGVRKAADLPWRFCDADSGCLSRPARG